MALFNDSIPANSEPVKLGAQRIREVKTTLNSTLGQIFSDAFTFVVGWVTGAQIQSDPTIDANRAITSNHLKDGSVITRVLADGALSADTAGRAKMEDGFITQSKLDAGFLLPNSNVHAAQIAAGEVGTTQLADSSVTLAKLAAGIVPGLATGTYVGSDTMATQVSGLLFAPDFIFTTGGATQNECYVAFRAEASGSPLVGPAHLLLGVSGSVLTSAVQWTSDGFIAIRVNTRGLNNGGQTHSYIAGKAA